MEGFILADVFRSFNPPRGKARESRSVKPLKLGNTDRKMSVTASFPLFYFISAGIVSPSFWAASFPFLVILFWKYDSRNT